jgi:hypothetical protein
MSSRPLANLCKRSSSRPRQPGTVLNYCTVCEPFCEGYLHRLYLTQIDGALTALLRYCREETCHTSLEGLVMHALHSALFNHLHRSALLLVNPYCQAIIAIHPLTPSCCCCNPSQIQSKICLSSPYPCACGVTRLFPVTYTLTPHAHCSAQLLAFHRPAPILRRHMCC